MTKSVTDILADLLSSLGAPVAEDGSSYGAIAARLAQTRAAFDQYKAGLAEATPAVLDEVMTFIKTNQCDHRGHRVLPTSADDVTAALNALRALIGIQVDLSKKVAMNGFTVGMSLARGNGTEVDIRLDATFGVINAAVLEMSDLLAEDDEAKRVGDMWQLYAEFERRTRKRVNDSIENLLTGKPPEEEAERHRCH